MPLKAAHLLSVKHGVVELSLELLRPTAEDPAILAETLEERLFEQQLELMCDARVLDPPDLAADAVIESRDPIPAKVGAALEALGFRAEDTPSGGTAGRPLLARLTGTRTRARLERWSLRYARPTGALARFEETLLAGGPVERVEPRRVIDAAAAALGLTVRPDRAGLEALEARMLAARPAGRPILHPLAVRALAAFVAGVIMAAAPKSRWVSRDEDEVVLHVQANDGAVVETDPVARVAAFVARGRNAGLSAYTVEVVRQSLTMSAQA